MDEIVNKVILKLEGKLSDGDLREVRDAMRAVMSGYQIQPMTTEITTYEYQLPECYKMYIASKVMDGRMSERSRILYRDVLEKIRSHPISLEPTFWRCPLVRTAEKSLRLLSIIAKAL